MSIGSQIKERRHALNMSQEMLANKLGVTRSAISNWEVGRNYPDLQLIISLSNVLEIPLDLLLKDDTTVVTKISADTVERKKLSKKIHVLYVALFILIVLCCLALFNTRYQNISASSQIKEVVVTDDLIEIEVDLPFYRSLETYCADKAINDSSLNVTLITKRNLLLKNNQKIEIPRDIDENIEQIRIVNKNEFIKEYKCN